MRRYHYDFICKDLEKKMVLLVGPRQVGKTWLAKNIAEKFSSSVYLNYDLMNDRTIIENQSWLPSVELVILDEIHKMPNWKNTLKGIFDTKPPAQRLLVTGSARLDTYDRVGDSLAGRYFRYRLFPLSLPEIHHINPTEASSAILVQLLHRGGFPEPFLADTDVDAQRWRLQYVQSLLSTDVFDIDNIQNLRTFRLVFELLRQKVGSPVSYQSLAEDAHISPHTVKKYIQILEALFVVFSVTPYSRNIARSLLKEPKIYFYDTALVQGNEGARLENEVALSLLNHTYLCYDLWGEEVALHYLRTKDGEEVDFLRTRDNTPFEIIEVKQSDHQISKSLRKFKDKYGFPAVQLVHYLRHEYEDKGIRVMKVENYLQNLWNRPEHARRI